MLTSLSSLPPSPPSLPPTPFPCSHLPVQPRPGYDILWTGCSMGRPLGKLLNHSLWIRPHDTPTHGTGWRTYCGSFGGVYSVRYSLLRSLVETVFAAHADSKIQCMCTYIPEVQMHTLALSLTGRLQSHLHLQLHGCHCWSTARRPPPSPGRNDEALPECSRLPPRRNHRPPTPLERAGAPRPGTDDAAGQAAPQYCCASGLSSTGREGRCDGRCG